MKVGRNEPCPCGSGKKYKHCHLAADELQQRASRKQKEAAEAVESEGDDSSGDFGIPGEGLPGGMDARETLKFFAKLSRQGSGTDLPKKKSGVRWRNTENSGAFPPTRRRSKCCAQ